MFETSEVRTESISALAVQLDKLNAELRDRDARIAQLNEQLSTFAPAVSVSLSIAYKQAIDAAVEQYITESLSSKHHIDAIAGAVDNAVEQAISDYNIGSLAVSAVEEAISDVDMSDLVAQPVLEAISDCISEAVEGALSDRHNQNMLQEQVKTVVEEEIEKCLNSVVLSIER